MTGTSGRSDPSDSPGFTPMRPWYRFILALADGILRVVLTRDVKGTERIPRSGPFILASNHGSFWDPPVLATSIPRELYFLAKSTLFEVPLFGALIRSVNALPIRRGANDPAGITRAIGTLERGGVLLLFPEGGRMKDGQLHPARPGLGLIEAQARVPIVPVYVRGTNRIRRCLVRAEKVRIRFGEPLPETLWFPAGMTTTRTGRELHQEIGDRVMQEIARLRDGLEAEASARVRSGERGDRR
jgi:1-acyl-sn-glycerol-3-phosphate acyltransferase